MPANVHGPLPFTRFCIHMEGLSLKTGRERPGFELRTDRCGTWVCSKVTYSTRRGEKVTKEKRGGRRSMAVPKVVQPTPSWLKSYAVVLSSLLAGASIVHNILKPDLTIPTLESDGITSEESQSEVRQTSSVQNPEAQKLPSTQDFLSSNRNS